MTYSNLFAIVFAIGVIFGPATAIIQPINVGEVTLNVRFEGNPKGVPVVMLHGFPEAMGVWDPVLEVLFNTYNDNNNYYFIVPDMRGYNGSQAPPNITDYNINNLVADIFGLINATTNGQQVILIAHDWGGLVSWAFAHQHPEMLRAFAVLNCPHPDVINNLLRTNTQQELSAVYLLGFIHHPVASVRLLSLFNYKGARVLFPPISDQLTNDLEASWSKSLLTMMYYYPANFDTVSSISFNNLTSTLPSPCTVDVPTLFFWGGKDPAYIQANADPAAMAPYVPSLRVLVYPDAGHFLQLDSATQLASDLHAFLLKYGQL